MIHVNRTGVVYQKAKVTLWFLDEKCMATTGFAIKDHHENILVFDVLNR